MSTPSDILLVEDEDALAELLRRVLVRAGYTVRIAADGHQALAALDVARPAVLILDLVLPVINGFAVLEQIHQRQIIVPIVVITANPLNDEALPHTDIRRVLVKPFPIGELVAAIHAIRAGQRYA